MFQLLNLFCFIICVCFKSVVPNESVLISIDKNNLSITGGMSRSLLKSISYGENLAIEHCQETFKWDRWNCPESSFLRHSKQEANKEAAFSKAILAAGIVHTITKNCSRGEIKECGCDPNLAGRIPQPFELIKENKSTLRGGNTENLTESDWTWGGCSDDSLFGRKIARELLYDSEKTSDAVAYVGRHNYNVGIEVIHQTMVRKCRCHGTSGSCSLQTCWMQVAPFKNIARKLRERYNRATRVTQASVESSIALDNSVKQDYRKREIPVSDNSLVYLEQSPDYCIANKTEGWLGTKGRICSRSVSDMATVSEKKSCRNLCRTCGHRVKKRTKTITTRCNCNFVWCCSVKCDTCVETVEEFFCD